MTGRPRFALVTLLFVVVLAASARFVARDGAGPASPEPTSLLDEEIARQERIRRHAEPSSPEAIKATEKIRRLEGERAGRPRPENPDKFQEILYRMRVPADRETPGYEPGYRMRELQRARQVMGRGVPLPWVSRGPGNVAGRARGLIVDPDDPTDNTWYVGSVGGGVWKTTNAGGAWTLLTPDFPTLAVSTLAMAASDHDVIYAGTGESMFSIDVIGGDGIFKSTDRGVSWSQLASTTSNQDFHNIARIIVDPSDEDVLLAAATSGRYRMNVSQRSKILKSTDGGVTWTVKFSETEIGGANRVKKVLQLVATPGNFNVLFAGVDENGILRSTNAGETWTYSNSGITDFRGRFEIAISPVDTSTMFAAAEGNNHSELWLSTDAGLSWSETFESGSEPNWLGFQGWYDNTIVCHPTQEFTVFVGGIRLWQIDVTGTSRTSTFLASGVHVDHHGLEVLNPGGSWRLLNSSDGGVAVSSSGASGWSQPTDGMVTTQFYGVDKAPGRSAYTGGTQDNGTWLSPYDPDALTGWTHVIGGDGYETSWHFNDPLLVIGGSQYNGLRRSTDGGATWGSATSGLFDTGSGSAPFVTKIAESATAPDLLFAVGESGVWRSTNFGANWSLIPLSSPNWTLTSFLDVKISRANSDVVWAGGHMDDTTGRIHVSTDGGASFDPVPNFAAVTMGLISGMATHPTDDQTAYVLFSFAERPKILRTTDLGASWTDISGFGTGSTSTNGFPDVAVYDLLVRPDDTNILWAGTEIGLVESTDNGGTWALANNGFPSATIWSMTHVEDEVVLGTHGRGIWSVSIPGMIAGATFSPLIENLTQSPTGLLDIAINLRSAYDATQVWVEGVLMVTLPANSPGDTELVQLPVLATGNWDVQLRGIKDFESYDSPVKSVDVYLLAPPTVAYTNDFDAPSSDFVGTGFTIGPRTGFLSDAIHSPHPYSNAATLTYTLTVPIVVAATGNTMLEYDDVALIEPGEPGSEFGDSNFWDYVIVEGTRDGSTWIPLADGYDAGFDSDWLTAYNFGTPGNSTMFVHHAIDLTSTFTPGETVLVRLRLFADAAATGWGWAVDNLEIQAGNVSTGVEELAAGQVALAQNFPNPFDASTRLRFELPSRRHVALRIYDVQGREVRTLVDAVQPAGARSVVWDARNNEGRAVASGVYLYRLTAGDIERQKKMLLLR